MVVWETSFYLVHQETDYKSFYFWHINFCIWIQTLKFEMSQDTSIKSHVCHICEHKSVNNSSLERHMRVHSNEKPFKCELCDWASKWSGELARHISRHSGQKRFECNVCNFRTAFNSNLRAHMRKHTGEKPFACDKCNFRTARRFNLKKHQGKMHSSEIAVQESPRLQKDEKPFKCELRHYRSSSEQADADKKPSIEEYLNNDQNTAILQQRPQVNLIMVKFHAEIECGVTK